MSVNHTYEKTYCVNVWTSTYQTNLKTHICTVQKKSVSNSLLLFNSLIQRDIFINQRILPLDKLINLQIEGNQRQIPAKRISQPWRW